MTVYVIVSRSFHTDMIFFLHKISQLLLMQFINLPYLTLSCLEYIYSTIPPQHVLLYQSCIIFTLEKDHLSVTSLFIQRINKSI